MRLPFRDKFSLAASLAIWITAGVMGCQDVNSAMRISAAPQVHDRPTVYDPAPTYHADFYVAERVDKPIGEMPKQSSDWAAFNAWKSNTDPRAPGAAIRRWFREQDQR